MSATWLEDNTYAESTYRRRERNAGRSVEVLPPDVETKVVALRGMTGESQTRAVTAMLSHSRTGLLAAIAAQDLPQIVEWKAKGSAVQEIAKQLRLGKDMQLDAAEFLRRAERGLGRAIREGQADGTIAVRGQHRSSTTVVDEGRSLPTDYAAAHELHGRGQEPNSGIYAMADGVSDEAFEEALAEAKAEENLSRANVARKARERSDDPPSATPGPHIGRCRKTPHARKTVETLAVVLGNLALSVEEISPEEVDAQQLQSEITSISNSLGTIRAFIKKVNK